MNKIKQLLSWLVVGFIGLCALGSFPSFSSILLIVCALLAAPIAPIREFLLNKGLKGFTKAGLISAVFIASVMIYPTPDPEAPEASEDSPAVEEPAEIADTETLVPSKAPAQNVVKKPVSETAEEDQAVSEPSTTAPVIPSKQATTKQPAAQEPVSQPEEPKPIPGNSKGNYVASTDSNKYHRPVCPHANKILEENETWFETPEEAEEHNYLPCGSCMK